MTTLLNDVSEASGELSEARASARTAAVETIRYLEDDLVAALDGERLRGVGNVNPVRKAPPFFAYRIRGKVDSPLPFDRGVLVVDESGMLMIAIADRDGCVESHAAEDYDLNAEDLEPYAQIVMLAISRHLDATATATARYRRCIGLAEAIRKALDEIR